MKKDILLVDGYNMIGAWPELRDLKHLKLAEARDRLIDQLAEYQAYKGWRVILVFDAYLVPGIENKQRHSNVEVVFTRENETADERIERLVSELAARSIQLHVATSDFTEQWIIFGQGALRISARELELEMREIEQIISAKVQKIKEERSFSKIPLSDEVAEIFEKWRRGNG